MAIVRVGRRLHTASLVHPEAGDYRADYRDNATATGFIPRPYPLGLPTVMAGRRGVRRLFERVVGEDRLGPLKGFVHRLRRRHVVLEHIRGRDAPKLFGANLAPCRIVAVVAGD